MAVVALLELSVIAAMLFALEWSNPGFLPVVCSAPESVAECASGPVAVTMVLLAALFLLALHSRRALTACQRTARDEATRKHEIAWELMAMRNSAMHSDESVRVGRSFKPQPSDVFVVTYPKCGTTWVTQILHALRTAGSMDFGEITEVVPWVILAHELTLTLSLPLSLSLSLSLTLSLSLSLTLTLTRTSWRTTAANRSMPPRCTLTRLRPPTPTPSRPYALPPSTHAILSLQPEQEAQTTGTTLTPPLSLGGDAAPLQVARERERRRQGGEVSRRGAQL